MAPYAPSTTALLLLCCSQMQYNEAFQSPHPHSTKVVPGATSSSCSSRSSAKAGLLFAEKYGRGAEIYPATNENKIKITDSFANGELPPTVKDAIEFPEGSDAGIEEGIDDGTKAVDVQGSGDDNNINDDGEEVPKIPKRERVRKAIQLILRSAAKSETETTPLLDTTPLNKRPPIIAVFLMVLGLVRPNHFLSVVFITGYLVSLGLLASSPKSAENMNPILWSVPPQGHVPSLLSNPLGSIGSNPTYFSWLRIGVIFGYITPFVYLFKTILTGKQHLSETVAANLFLLSCQIMTEEMSRKVLTPLPIRILIPLIYNSLRMGPLYQWVLCWSSMSPFGKLLSLTNFVYWGVNLFLFLIPIASVKYLRSYFFCVEAEEVVVRDGDEDNIGLLGR